MFEKLKTPAFLRSARESLAGQMPPPVFKTLLLFLLVYIVTGILQSFLLTPVLLVQLFTNKEYFSRFSDAVTTGDQAPLLEITEQMMGSDAVRVANLFATVMICAAAVFFCRVIEKRSLSSMGFRKRRAFSSALLGAGFALLLLCGAFAFAYFFGSVTFSFATDTSPTLLLLFFLGFLVQGLAEETLFRGYLTVSLARGRSLSAAVLVGSFLFAYFHRAGEGATPLAFLNFFLLGVLLSLYMIRFGNLFGAAVLHAMWNVGLGLVAGSPVSGEAYPISIFSITFAEGASFIHGGAFGLEGGIAATCALAVGIALLGMMPTRED